MFFSHLALSFPAWRPHFSFLENPLANEMMVLRWLHLIFGIIWIGLLYFFNLVLTPAMKQIEPAARLKIYPALMSKAMGWFRWSALVTVLVGIRYFQLHLFADARLAGDHSLAAATSPAILQRASGRQRVAHPRRGATENTESRPAQ